ncbi:MAG: N-acetylmuramoyl-L-alanine amidase protein [Nitrospirae bacterium]|nr:N-acetylmuramoyl-L-alanine amidase protein [Nitrospirota bacterium]
MKKTAFLLFFIFLSAHVSGAESYKIKLRTGQHAEFFRIVLEGPASVISKAIVNQKSKNIQVVFPDTAISIDDQKSAVAYKKTAEDTVIFFPLDFSGFKVLTLENPDRLVIDLSVHPERSKEGRREKFSGVKTVVIDPGHGGNESGLVIDEHIEKNAVLDIAKTLKAIIENGPGNCFLTRGSDMLLSLDDRVKFSNGKNADVFLSLHIGNHGNVVIYAPVIAGSVPESVKPFLLNKGQEKFMPDTFVLLNAVKKAIAADFGDDMVAVKSLPYSMLSKIEAAAIIVELPSFKDADYTSDWRSLIATAISKGIKTYEEDMAK